MDLKKVPAISETIDWARTLILLNTETLSPDLVRDTLNVILKFQEDIETVKSELHNITNKALLQKQKKVLPHLCIVLWLNSSRFYVMQTSK